MFQPTAERLGRKRVRKNKRMQTATRRRHQPHLARPRRRPLLGRSQPPSAVPPSVRPSVHPRLLRVRVTEPAPLPTLPICLSVCVLACLKRVFHFGWLVARAPCSCHLLHSAWRPGRQAGRPSFTPQFLAPSRSRAPLWRKCLPTIGLRRCRRRRLPSNRGLQWTHADSNAVAATLAGRQSSPTPLCNMVL